MSKRAKGNVLFFAIALSLFGKPTLIANDQYVNQDSTIEEIVPTDSTENYSYENTDQDVENTALYVLVMSDENQTSQENAAPSISTTSLETTSATQAPHAHTGPLLTEIEESEDTDDFTSIEQEIMEDRGEFFLVSYFKEFGVMLFLKYLDMQELYYEWRDYLMEQWYYYVWSNNQDNDAVS